MESQHVCGKIKLQARCLICASYLICDISSKALERVPPQNDKPLYLNSPPPNGFF